MGKLIIALFCFVLLFSCKKSGITQQPEFSNVQTINCIPGAAGCSELQIQGDNYYIPQPGQPLFSGYADPGLRKDPQSSALYLTYSWPHYTSVNSERIAAVEIHMAQSTDGGNRFSFVKNLWPIKYMNNPASPTQAGCLNNETSNLLPVTENGNTTWYATSLNYFSSNTGSGTKIAGNSFQIRVYKASTPEALETAPYSIIGTSTLHNGWGSFKNLSVLSPELNNLDFWNEPSLYYENGSLYLILVSFDYDAAGNPIMANNNVYVFSTIPSGDPDTWQWNYKGKLSGQLEANELGGERLTQIDIAKARDGKLLMIATPDDWNASEMDYNHKGCKIIEVKSLSNPALERGSDGKLKLRAVVTASDANALGSAASTYDPASNTGVLFTRRQKTPTSFTINIWRTGLHP